MNLCNCLSVNGTDVPSLRLTVLQVTGSTVVKGLNEPLHLLIADTDDGEWRGRLNSVCRSASPRSAAGASDSSTRRQRFHETGRE